MLVTPLECMNHVLERRSVPYTQSSFSLSLSLSLSLSVVTLYLYHDCPDRHLESIKNDLLQQLQNLKGAPSVQMQQVPPLFETKKADEIREENPDERPKAKTRHGDGDRKAHEAELYDKVD